MNEIPEDVAQALDDEEAFKDFSHRIREANSDHDAAVIARDLYLKGAAAIYLKLSASCRSELAQVPRSDSFYATFAYPACTEITFTTGETVTFRDLGTFAEKQHREYGAETSDRSAEVGPDIKGQLVLLAVWDTLDHGYRSLRPQVASWRPVTED